MPFFMVFTRVAAVFIIIPFLNTARIPNAVKLLISLTFTIVVFPTLKAQIDINTLNYFEIFYKIAAELLVGISIGFFVTVVYLAIQ